MKKIAKPILEISNLCRSDKKSTVERFELSVPYGDSFAVLYENESNISLLIEILAGRISPKKGKIFFKGDEVTGSKNVFGIIRKDPNIQKRKTVADVSAAPVVKRGLSRELANVLVAKESRLFGADTIIGKQFSELSKEQTALALLFSAYMCSHELIVIDEPFSRLSDEESRKAYHDKLGDLRRSTNLSLLIFTKDIDTAVSLGDYVMVVNEKTESKGIIAIDRKKEQKARERVEELYNSK